MLRGNGPFHSVSNVNSTPLFIIIVQVNSVTTVLQECAANLQFAHSFSCLLVKYFLAPIPFMRATNFDVDPNWYDTQTADATVYSRL
jgi:hypothetical protein